MVQQQGVGGMQLMNNPISANVAVGMGGQMMNQGMQVHTSSRMLMFANHLFDEFATHSFPASLACVNVQRKFTRWKSVCLLSKTF